jgi:hypothetical protein
MSELRRFEGLVALFLCSFLIVAGTMLVATGHPRMAAGLVAGALVGMANLAWMVGTARRLLGRTPTLRQLQVAGTIRFLTVAVLFGTVLLVGRVDPVTAVIGYGCFPIAGAVAGWRIMRGQPGPVI